MTVIERPTRNDRWDDAEDEAARGGWSKAFKPLTREQAQALRAADPPLSPWRVVAVQGAVGVAVALLALLLTGRQEVGWSALYGAATVVVPGALMARGIVYPTETWGVRRASAALPSRQRSDSVPPGAA